MRVIAIACEKGGAGKTTTAMQLAAALTRRGLKAAVLDSDISGGATTWAQMAAEAGTPLPYSVLTVNRAQLNRRTIGFIAAGADYILIDTPPSDTATIQTAIDCADLTVIPTQPGKADLYLAGLTYRAASVGIVLLTRAKPRTRLLREALDELGESETPRFDTLITERESVHRLYGTDKADSLEYPDLAEEILGLYRTGAVGGQE